MRARDAGKPGRWWDVGEIGGDVQDVRGEAGDSRGRFAGYLKCFVEGWATWHQDVGDVLGSNCPGWPVSG